jgi:short-subunit dehydrogenase
VARKLSDSTIVVTGASSGVGRAAALRLAKKGATVVVAARRSHELRSLAEECRSHGTDALAVPTDVSDAEAVEQLARTTIENFGRIDGWVNNAAVLMFSRVEDAHPDDLQRLIETNILGYLYGARAVVPWMREQGEGTIVNVGSVLSVVPAPYLSAYVMSKAAALALSGCLRTELRDAPSIKVGTVLPGAIDTPFFQHAANRTGYRPQPLKPTYSVDRVGRAVVSCLRHPRKEIYVGAFPRVTASGYRLSRTLVEPKIARAVQEGHFSDERVEPTSGNLHLPMSEGGDASGGWQDGSSVRKIGAAAAAASAAAAAAALAIRRKAA